MKKFLFGLMLVGSNLALATNWDDPLKPFDASKNQTKKVELTWLTVDNPAQACETEAKRRFRDFKGYGYAPDACAFWDESFKTCTVITKKRPSMHDLGHEVRHCFQGHWH